MAIKSFAMFGYDGSIVTVKADVSEGTSHTDIAGLADGEIVGALTRIQSSMKAPEVKYPSGQVTISLLPADLQKKGASFDLPMALAVLENSMSEPKTESVLALGELDFDGNVLPVRGVYAALQTAKGEGIRCAIVPAKCDKAPDGIRVIEVTTLKEACNALKQIYAEPFFSNESNGFTVDNDKDITFYPDKQDAKIADQSLTMALAIAAAGRHSMLAYGPPGCGKTIAMERITQFLPNLSADEQASVNRIWSLAGLTKPGQKIYKKPFRMPHQTASIEGICGGGPDCRPGEISLAHNGILFLDEAAEFRTSVLQMLRVPLETGQITLSRAGRSTVYPAKFQLLMATNPCPCGNYGSKDKVCLCSAKSIEQYWKKFSEPLLDRVAIHYNCNRGVAFVGSNLLSLGTDEAELRDSVKRAVLRQLEEQGKYNQDLTHDELQKKMVLLTNAAKAVLDNATANNNLSATTKDEVVKLAFTIRDMRSIQRCGVWSDDIELALKLHGGKIIDFTE